MLFGLHLAFFVSSRSFSSLKTSELHSRLKTASQIPSDFLYVSRPLIHLFFQKNCLRNYSMVVDKGMAAFTRSVLLHSFIFQTSAKDFCDRKTWKSLVWIIIKYQNYHSLILSAKISMDLHTFSVSGEVTWLWILLVLHRVVKFSVSSKVNCCGFPIEEMIQSVGNECVLSLVLRKDHKPVTFPVYYHEPHTSFQIS